MREMGLVLIREFLERVRTRSFVIGTVLFPALVVAVLLLPLMTGASAASRLVVVNEAPAPLGQLFVTALNGAFIPGIDSVLPQARRTGAVQYDIEITPGPESAIRSALLTRIAAGDLAGYVLLPADLRQSGQVRFRSTRSADPGMLQDIRVAATEALQADRLARRGVDMNWVATLLQPASLAADIGGDAVRKSGADRQSFYFAYIVAMVTYFVVALYGSGVTRSVLEEKSNRIAEVLVSTMRATHLMAGKILGVTAAVLLQLLIWAVVLAVLVTRSSWISHAFGVDASILTSISAHPGPALVLGIYFLLGFLLYAALFAALGASVTTDQEAQSFQMLFMLPLFVPILFLIQLTARPLDQLARILGMIPFTAPVAMPMRMGATEIPPTDIFLSLLLLGATCALVTWLAGRIFRIGLLFTGRRPSARELLDWVRTG